MAARPSFVSEIGPDGLAKEHPVIAYTEKVIEEEQLQLRRYIEENYSKIRDVERELTNLSLELKLTAGPKKAALEHLRKKIESSTERIRVAKLKEEEAQKEWQAASKVVKDEEEIKQKLCDDLNRLVQESSAAQFSRLEELKRRLECLNPSRASTADVPVLQDAKVARQTQSNTASSNVGSQSPSQITEVSGSESVRAQGKDVAVANGHNQSTAGNSEGRGKRYLNLGRGQANILSKGRGSLGSGWTGAGFDS